LAPPRSEFSPAFGQLLVKTGVSGRASRIGHRLTIVMNSWQAAVSWTGDEPSAVELTVDVESLEVLRGEGGLTPMSGPEKALARANALNCLGAGRHPTISFRADDVERTADGYRLTGTLEIHGKARPRRIDLRVEDLARHLADVVRSAGSPIGVRHQALLEVHGCDEGCRRGDCRL
jgi:polyisoprenoid-binding protein YceI